MISSTNAALNLKPKNETEEAPLISLAIGIDYLKYIILEDLNIVNKKANQ